MPMRRRMSSSSLQDRHFRQHDPGSAGQRRACRRLSRHRPIDIIEEGSGAGVLHEDLREACLAALALPRENAHSLARKFTWEAASKQFLNNVLIAQGRKSLAPPPAGFNALRT